MDKKYLIILLFIFLVFLMGSINSTITNNFYNNTTGSQDHYNLTNLSFDDSGHTGFQSSDTLDSDISALGYITNSYHDDDKLNKTNDTADYMHFQDVNYTVWVGKTVAVDFGTWFFDVDNAQATTTAFRASKNGGSSTQFYGYSGTSSAAGMLHRFAMRGAVGNITIPSEVKTGKLLQFDFQGFGAGGGTAFNSASTRIETNFTQNGTDGRGATLDLYATANSGSLTKFLSSNGTHVNFPSLVGSGNRPLCADSDGNIIICP